MDGAIFDMDGVLLDNLDFHLEAFLQLGREEGKELSPEDVESVFGQRNWDMLRKLIGSELSQEEAERMGDRKEEIYRMLIAQNLKETVVTGMLSFVSELAAEGVPIALATSGPPENVDLVLDTLEIRKFFSAIVTGSEVKKGKPDPEVFMTAAARLRVPPEKCVVFEDSLSGVQAALGAGCKCVALATTHAPAELKPEKPDLIIDDFHRLTWKELTGRISNQGY